MTYTALALATLLANCKASYVAVGTQVAIIAHESGGNPNAIHDNTTGRSYYPATRAEASELANDLLSHGHDLDVGLGQGNSGNFAGWNVTADDMLDPCINVNVTGGFLESLWMRAFSAVSYDRSRERQALFMLASLYNKNSLFGAPKYVNEVLDSARSGYVRHTVAIYWRFVRQTARKRSVKRDNRPVKSPTHNKVSARSCRNIWQAASLTGGRRVRVST